MSNAIAIQEAMPGKEYLASRMPRPETLHEEAPITGWAEAKSQRGGRLRD